MHSGSEQEALSPRGIRVLCLTLNAFPLLLLPYMYYTMAPPVPDPDAAHMFETAFWGLVAVQTIVMLILKHKHPEGTKIEQQTKAIIMHAFPAGVGLFAMFCAILHGLWTTWIGFAVLSILTLSLVKIDPRLWQEQSDGNPPV